MNQFNLFFYIKLYLLTLAAFFAIDMVWLGLVARGFYRQHLGYLMAPRANGLAAGLFYLLFIAGLLVFAVLPGLEAHELKAALWRGALLGLIAYATYDLTNMATIKDWPLIVTVVDMLWGVVLASLVTCAGFLIGQWLM